MGVFSAFIGELLIKICISPELGWCRRETNSRCDFWEFSTQRTKQGTYLEIKRSRLKFPLLSHAWSPPKLQYSAGTNLSLRALWVFGSACFHSLPNPKLIFWAILVNRVIQKRTITYTNMTEGSLWPQAPIFPGAIEASHIYMIKTSPSNRFPSVWSSPPFISLNAILFCCALLRNNAMFLRSGTLLAGAWSSHYTKYWIFNE